MKFPTPTRLEIFLDSDTGISFETCRRISRHLESVLDEQGWLGEQYTLEVSSPGVGRPLSLQRQYPKNVGRKVKVKFGEGEKVEGTLTEVTDDAITVEYKERIKEGKRKKTQVTQRRILFADIKETTVKITF